MPPRGDNARAARPRVSAAGKLEPSKPLYRREFPSYGRSLLALALTSACIIPDSGIDARGEAVNPGAVRLIQSTALTERANRACKDAGLGLANCPMIPDVLYGLVDEELCSCPSPLVDRNPLPYFDIYVEDPDADDDGNPLDSIFGVFLLDMPNFADDPSEFVAYENLLPPTTPAAPVPFGLGYANAIERPEPLVRRWTIEGENGAVDFCNDNASSQPPTLEPGLHSVRLVVTDRPWYRALVYDDQGRVVVDEKTKERVRVPVEEASIGVPDTQAGATYAVANYVFECGDGITPPAEGEQSPCQCADPNQEMP
jgi:hypothetical protein